MRPPGWETPPPSWALAARCEHVAQGTLQKMQGRGAHPSPPPSPEECTPTECTATRPFFAEVELRCRKGVTKVTRPGVPAGGGQAQTPSLPLAAGTKAQSLKGLRRATVN